jgi:hypothetical protein
MVVVMPNVSGNAWQPPVVGAIKDGFMRADGTVITVTHVSQGCVFAAGTVLPNMVQKYPRGNITSGTTGGANTFTPAGTNAASNVPASGLTFSGTSGTYTVSVPAHYHGFGTGSGLGNGEHTHSQMNVYLNYHTGSTGSEWHPTAATSGNSTLTKTGLIGSGESGHGHTGTIGLVTGGSNGNAAFSASGSNTPAGTIAGSATAAAQAFTGTAANSEPAYVEVVWVIRVK